MDLATEGWSQEVNRLTAENKRLREVAGPVEQMARIHALHLDKTPGNQIEVVARLFLLNKLRDALAEPIDDPTGTVECKSCGRNFVPEYSYQNICADECCALTEREKE